MKVKHDPFLSEILGCPCGTVTQWSKPFKFGNYNFLTFKTSNFKHLQEALKQGFHYITTNVYLQRTVSNHVSKITKRQFVVRSLKKADIQQVLNLARKSFTLDRFHLDPQLGKQQADAIYECWAKNDCKGRARDVLVAQKNGTVIGFLTIHRQAIDLLAVHPHFASQGVGTSMLHSALKKYPIKETVTQINNPVISFYQRRGGFIPSRVIHVLHWWRSDS